jgi:cytochrome P450
MTIQHTPTIEFDHHSAEVAQDPAGSYARLREQCPAFWTESHGGYWVFTRYDEVAEILNDDARFSSARRSDAGGDGSAVSIPKRPAVPQYPIELDPPEMFSFRRILNPLLSPAAGERLRPAIQQRVSWLVDRFVERGQCDLVSDLVSPVPASVTVDWLGLPHDTWHQMGMTMHNIIARAPGDPVWARASSDLVDLYDVMRSTIAARKTEPRDDVISYIVQQEIDGQLITNDDALSVVALLIAGGVGTTSSLSAQSLVWLSQHRDCHQRLLSDSRFLRVATEEFLRYFAPVQALARTTRGDTEFHGCPMADADRLLVAFGSANRDSRAFDDPDELQLDRFPNRHLSFGVGVHRCAGSNLARIIFQEVIRGVLTRLPDYRVDTTALEPYPSQGLSSGWQSVPTMFTPTRPLGIDSPATTFGLAGVK